MLFKETHVLALVLIVYEVGFFTLIRRTGWGKLCSLMESGGVGNLNAEYLQFCALRISLISYFPLSFRNWCFC